MRIKKIKNNKFTDLFDEWVDFQRSFDQMLGVNRQSALEEALRISKIRVKGRSHDGLCDAYNTAKLFVKVQRQSVFSIKFTPIREYEKERESLRYSLGELFTPTLLAQISPEGDTIAEEANFEEENWIVWRKIYRLFKGKKAANDEHWNKLLFGFEMNKINIADLFFGKIRLKKEICL